MDIETEHQKSYIIIILCVITAVPILRQSHTTHHTFGTIKHFVGIWKVQHEEKNRIPKS